MLLYQQHFFQFILITIKLHTRLLRLHLFILFCKFSLRKIYMISFLSRVSTLTRDIDIAILSVCLSVCP